MCFYSLIGTVLDCAKESDRQSVGCRDVVVKDVPLVGDLKARCLFLNLKGQICHT